ncbi:hypothetical protein [Oxalicibacterium solurbis]|uniref:Uncharacterized protein n=1 Tax=Oxalicibacterium solurbis TaxID=69280 RepID=A0A8J3F7V9_9BURK|nr:hypothetical protein [Oxalicibacterium solurbis]GGI52848.1 hypothetical protein GCM10011430_00220 [Oxalicibacterium solurbis]
MRLNTLGRMGTLVLLTWMPILLLSTLDGWAAVDSFLSDFNAHARYLVALPLLAVAEASCLPRLSTLAENFWRAGLVSPADRPLFTHITSSTRRILNSVWMEAAIVIAAYVLILTAYRHISITALPGWVYDPALKKMTPAGWWVLLVSLPLLLASMLGWLWRLLVWTRFLWKMSRMNLRLVAVHPDGAAGLGFLGYSSHVFALLACALGVLGAGHVGNALLHGASLGTQYVFALGFAAGVVVLLNLPLLVFTPHLLHAWRIGTIEYGILADHFGRDFERKWLNRMQPLDSKVLEQPDFSAAADLYQIVDRSHDIHLLPLHLKSVMLMTIAALLPFMLVALMTIPVDIVVDKLIHLLF